MDTFVYLLFGHIAGDYLFQNKTMALRKGLSGTPGHTWCAIHTLVYIACIWVFLTGLPMLLNSVHGSPFLEVFNLSIWFYVLNAVLHYVMDKWSLGQKWLDAIRGRNLLDAYNSTDDYREIAIVFAAIVYVAVDNGLHLMLMWYTAKAFGA